MWPYYVAYQEFVGPYTSVSPTMETVYQWLQANDITSSTWIGLYYDNPQTTPSESLRSEVWSLITKEQLLVSSSVYSVKTIPARKSIVATFPYKNKFSYMIGPMKVYPALEKYLSAMGYVSWSQDLPTIELYDMDAKQIIYIVQPTVTGMVNN